MTVWKSILLMALLGTLAHAKEFVIDNAHSNVGFTIKHMMISNVKGSFDAYTADIDYDTAKKVFTKLNAKVTAASVNTNNQKRDEHLRSSDFFSADEFKYIQFEMTSMKDGKINGDLTIRDVTHHVTLNAKVHGLVKDFQGYQRLGFTLEGKISRKEFDLTWNKVLESGGVAVDDTVNLIIDVEAIEL